MDTDITKQVGLRIKYYRKHRNLSLEQLALKINRSKSAISKYENGNISGYQFQVS